MYTHEETKQCEKPQKLKHRKYLWGLLNFFFPLFGSEFEFVIKKFACLLEWMEKLAILCGGLIDFDSRKNMIVECRLAD